MLNFSVNQDEKAHINSPNTGSTLMGKYLSPNLLS